MTDHPENSYLEPVKLIKRRESEILYGVTQVAEKQQLAEKRASALGWKPRIRGIANIVLSLGHIGFSVLYLAGGCDEVVLPRTCSVIYTR